MTAAQRRTVTIKIGNADHQVELTADVVEPHEATSLAGDIYHRTLPPRQRLAAGFGAQHVPAWTEPVTSQGGS